MKVNSRKSLGRIARRLLAPVGMSLVTKSWVQSHLSYLPAIPAFLQKQITPHPRRGPWTNSTRHTPQQLLTVPGIRRDPEAERAAYKSGPLPHFNLTYPLAFKAIQRGWWDCLLIVLGRMNKDNARAELTAK